MKETPQLKALPAQDQTQVLTSQIHATACCHYACLLKCIEELSLELSATEQLLVLEYVFAGETILRLRRVRASSAVGAVDR